MVMENLRTKIDLVISRLFDLRDMVMENLRTKIDLVVSRLSVLETKMEEMIFAVKGLPSKVTRLEEEGA